MPKLKTLSGSDIITILKSFNFFVAGQKGSHIKMKRMVSGISQTLTIPNHPELDRGTIRAIYNQASRYISPVELQKFFTPNKIILD
ncbi:MAG: type II toxin-antitoxin system HicA family toxin [Parcubacteria group bacterium]|nr:type II toxin-antitoxin system HicA family toxin [Parcubacteria group bacterium]